MKRIFIFFMLFSAVILSPVSAKELLPIKIIIMDAQWHIREGWWEPKIDLQIENTSSNWVKIFFDVYANDPDGIEEANDTLLVKLRPNRKKNITINIPHAQKREKPASKNNKKWTSDIYIKVSGHKNPYKLPSITILD